MVWVAANVCVVLVYEAAHPIKLLPVRVDDPDAPAVREVEQCFIVAVDKADILFFGHSSLLFKGGKCVAR